MYSVLGIYYFRKSMKFWEADALNVSFYVNIHGGTNSQTTKYLLSNKIKKNGARFQCKHLIGPIL